MIINKGESTTIAINLENYDKNRIKSIRLFVGITEYGLVEDGEFYVCRLSSIDTATKGDGIFKIFIWLDDTFLGVRKPEIGSLEILKTGAIRNNDSVSDLYDVTYILSISETEIIIEDVLYNYLRGADAFQVWQSQTGNAGKTKEDYFDWLQEPATEAVDLANSAAQEANTATGLANTAAEYANTQGDYAKAQGDYAKEKGDDALIAKELTEQATVDTRNIAIFAGDKADEANQAAILANNKAGLIDTATIAANNAAILANQKAGAANNAAILANEKAEYANAQGDFAKGIGEGVAANETIRIGAETIRLQNEIDRTNAEALRDSSETSRINAEGLRDSAESSRRSAEVLREQAKADTIEATENANTATGLANEATADYYDVVRPEIISQGEYATEQGDYAKQQGDLLNNRMPLFYGVEFAKGSLDPNSTRWIGDDAFKSNHVIFKDFKVAKVKDGKVIGVLNQTNWFEMEDGAPSGVVIDGTDVTDDGCDIMLVNEKGFYVLNGGTDPDFERRIVSDAPFHYGNDRAIYIEPFGMTVDFAIVKSGVSRCIRDNTHSGTATTGNGGVSYLADGLGVPTTYVNRFNADGYARAKNANNSLNVPYANTFHLDKNVWATLLFIKFQTKDLHNQDCIGPCISANDSTPNIWGDKTGIRVKNIDETYSHYNTNSSRFRSAVGGTSWNFYQLINNYRPLLKVFDCQLALSHAKQNNISQNTLFEYDGFQYSYENIQGSKGIADGEMTAKVRKFVTVQFTGYDNVDKVDVIDKDVEYCLEQGIVNGKIAGWGNVFEWISGIEGVIDGTDNSKYLFYKTDDVRKLTTDSDATDKDIGEKFSFQNSYDFLGSDNNVNGYVLKMFDNAIIGETLGGSLHTGECAYRYSSTSAPVDKLVRRGVYSGGYAYVTFCALRSAYAYYAPTFASSRIAFGFRVTLEKV